MKKTLLNSLLVAALLAVSASVQAQVPEGKVYIKNVQAGLWWGCANEWGTHASLIPHADYVTIMQENGAYTIETQVSNGGESYYFAGDYMDGAKTPFNIEQSGNYFTIANTNGEYFGTDNNTLANGTQILGKNVSGDNALWEIFTEDEMKASLNKATSTSPVDATFLIIDHTFGRNNRNVNVWEVSEDCTNKNLVGGNSNKHCAESYHSVFSYISQTLNDVPNGIYAFTAQGFYRQDGEDNDNLPEFFINDETAQVLLKTGSENSMGDACASFEAGLYKIEPIYVEVTDNTIKVGIQNPTNASLWVIWDNFELTYYGTDGSIDQIKNAALFAQVNELREKVASIIFSEEVEIDALLADLLYAYEVTKEVKTVDEANQAIEILSAVVSRGEGSVIAKNVLPKMEELVESTNVYTEEAYKTYYGEWYQKYEAGQITRTEAAALQDPSIVTGWHAQITCDNFLLSAWDTNPDFNNAAYYINTWSIEGDNDGSGFHVPFFEYWTGDDSSLGEKVLTATMNDLKAGIYNVTAWVRVRVKNNNSDEANGITLQVNDGKATNVCAGDEVAAQFFLKEFTATGAVGEDGVLAIKFNVAAENNISWLAFKNVKFAYDDVATGIQTIGNDAAAQKSIYNLAGLRVKNAQKGLFIIDGKKVIK